MVFLETVTAINNSKIVWGTTMMLFNLGSKHVMGDISPAQERLLSHAAVKRIVVFCMFFVATRDVAISVAMTFAFIFVFRVLLHEGSRFCIVNNTVLSSIHGNLQDQEKQQRKALYQIVKEEEDEEKKKQKKRKKKTGQEAHDDHEEEASTASAPRAKDKTSESTIEPFHDGDAGEETLRRVSRRVSKRDDITPANFPPPIAYNNDAAYASV